MTVRPPGLLNAPARVTAPGELLTRSRSAWRLSGRLTTWLAAPASPLTWMPARTPPALARLIAPVPERVYACPPSNPRKPTVTVELRVTVRGTEILSPKTAVAPGALGMPEISQLAAVVQFAPAASTFHAPGTAENERLR
jgi:hypothetical protein